MFVYSIVDHRKPCTFQSCFKNVIELFDVIETATSFFYFLEIIVSVEFLFLIQFDVKMHTYQIHLYIECDDYWNAFAVETL